MNKIALELNETLGGTAAARLLSDFGSRFYFPKGIISQSGEAKKKATRFNATVGMATKQNIPLFLPSIQKLITGLSENEIYPYAPTPGVPELRSAWKAEMEQKNPSLRGKLTSEPLVTSGLTHGIMIVADLFVNAGEKVVVPDMFWGNYRLIFEGRRQAELVTFPFFNESGSINLEALEQSLRSCGKKISLVLNFPNNPTGYSPSMAEARKIVDLLNSLAEEGNDVLCFIDDAYFGLFYEEGTLKESLFGLLADTHENLLAVKFDGATKEELAWGFRLGFITYGGKGLSSEQYTALQEKTKGAIRASISNASRMAQSLMLKGLQSPSHVKEKEDAFKLLEARYHKVREVLGSQGSDSPLTPLPFNSGYFMTFTYRGDAEKLRIHLLDAYGIGTIAIGTKYLRVAYSSVDIENIEELYTSIEKAARELL
ncbi:MAG: aminotransferase class I/II-fold pyridoxal phosphate-dependent enzyme [Spirochaetia bacterium]|nr:aminotransferase class I/II-fold pyridoxal phosphate-dependent enzyme [Spirochaetia bacterium]